MPPLPDPRATIVRNVFLFPADGTEPRIIPKTFSEAAAKATPASLFTRIVDLRGHYGKYMATTHSQSLDSLPHPDTAKCNEGEFIAYSNLSPELPVNQSVARIVGIDPIAIESKVFWRGDVIVVKAGDWPGPLIVGGGSHKIYHDIDPSFRATAESLFKRMYEEGDLKKWIKFTIEMERGSVKSDRTVRRVLQIDSPGIPISSMQPLDLKRHTKNIHLWRRVLQYYGEAETNPMSDKICALCGSTGKPDLKVCAGCRWIRYCSKECQKQDWKYHKLECKSKMPT